MPIIKKNKFMVIFWFSWAIALCIVILLRYYANQPNKSMSVKTIGVVKKVDKYKYITNNGYVYQVFNITNGAIGLNKLIASFPDLRDGEIIMVRYELPNH